jgi:ribose transport system ATP-binding protein
MRGIGKRFPGVVALDNVDLEIGRGEVLALCGENGAGKSTLMKILGGVYQPDAGTLQFDGRAVQIGSVNDSLALGVAFIHQELNVLDNLDVAANVFLGREPRTGPLRLIDGRKIHADTDVLLRRIGLDVSSHSRLDALSLAQQQMVEIAKALSLNARLIIMDEPTSCLTLKETDRLLELIGELRAAGVSVIYISHRLGEVERCADRVAVLRDGRNSGELRGADINHDRIVSLMVGRDLKTTRAPGGAATQSDFLQIRDLRTIRYPDKRVSFSAARGEILGIAGLIGAGRSELAKAVVGLDAFASGEVILDGAPVPLREPRTAIDRGLCLVPEDRRGEGLVVDMTVRENITLPSLRSFASWFLVSHARERTAAESQIAALRIKTPGCEVLALNLSGGNQQKIVLGKWLARNPRVLILDEPTRGIDVGAKGEIYRLMRELADRGTAILMISSDMEEVLHVSDRVAVMHEGAIAGVLPRAECTEERIMQLAVGKVTTN